MLTINILTTFITIFTIIDPFGLVPIFISVTRHLNKRERQKVVFISSLIALPLLIFFLYFGKFLIHALGLSYESFYIAGGILLFLVALDMLFARPRGTKQDQEEETDSADVAVFPIAIPMLAGPGTIASVIMFASHAKNNFDYLAILGCLIVSIGFAALAMYFSDNLIKVLRKTGLNVIDRLMGMILAAMAVQFIINALQSLGIIA
ncbi:MAG: MarC family transcriptional regulator [Candidatus Muiribacterium halophilum]|uniref:UPF0056 membrane protein n=1 Tax=Muiribacterium halophilum TaxID=2053465 RepID=A0A2N5ZJW5_MUIH1|nr:MAG: MarC family transcriptional regulator [Candidatus Muirbacterium halophilum]